MALVAAECLDLATLRARYLGGTLAPRTLVGQVLARIAGRGDDKVWIHRLPEAEILARADALAGKDPKSLPLYGIPFAIKDNIDLAGHPTTAGCPDYAYVSKESAPAIQRLIDAGALLIGKCNLDQFATGLNGTRSPYGVCANPFNPDYIPGGSSSGSAVAVAAGLVSFSLGTDTAGSGRVPAAFNNIVGLKPTRGLLSTRGVVPACRSLDCISILALTADDAQDVLRIAKGFDEADPFSRLEPSSPARLPASPRGCRFGVPRPSQLAFFGNTDGARLFAGMLGRIEALGGKLVEIDLAPFLEAARLLYEGPWIAERYAAIRDFIESRPEALLPVTRQIIGSGAKPLAADAFAASYRLKTLRRETALIWERIDVLITPTAGRLYTIAALLADPIRLNSELGYYTNFVNLLDLSAIAIPAGFQPDGLPFGVTLTAPAWSEEAICSIGGALHQAQRLSLGATGQPMPVITRQERMSAPRIDARTILLAVCGAHMSGLPLNHQLTERGARLVRRCRTAPHYRLYALRGSHPRRPGMIRAVSGKPVEVEIWEIPAETFGGFVAGIPAPLGIGTVELEDGEQVKGFLCEAYAVEQAEDITALGSWRRYLASLAAQQ